jgi:hypothetical protein
LNLRLDVLDWLLDIRDLGLDIRELLNRLLDEGLCDSGVGDHLSPLDWLVVNVLFYSLLGDQVHFDFLSDLRDVFSDMLDLLVVGVDSLDGDVVGLGHGLVLSDCPGDWHVLGPLLGDLLDVLSLVGHLYVTHLCFVVSVRFLNRDVLDVRLGLRLRLLVHSCRGLHHLRLHDRLNQRVLQVRNWLLVHLRRLVHW